MRILLQLTMMENRKALLLVILQLVCANLELLAALPLTSQSRAELSMLPGAARLPQERVRRKIGNLDTSTGPMEYMKQLRNNLTHSNGKPKNGEEDPTSVWCILDKDITQNTYREEPPNTKKCAVVNHFVFSWLSLAESPQARHLPVQKSTLRTYLQIIPRLIGRGKAVPVEITVHAGMHNSSQRAFAGRHQINATSESNGWVELNVTEGIQNLWPPSIENHEVVITLTLSVDCKKTKKVPASFVDPAGIPLTKAKRRQRHLVLQPMLLVYLSDKQVKDMVKREEQQPQSPAEEEEISLSEELQEAQPEEKRSTANSYCSKEDYMVNFRHLRLYHVLVPYEYNAKRCVGVCSHSLLTRRGHLGTNHAKIMASAFAVSQVDRSVVFRHQPRNPSCVPTRYSSMTLIVSRGQGNIEWEVYPAMVVEECGCR